MPFRTCRFALLVTGLALVSTVHTVDAQSAQKYALQFAVLSTSIDVGDGEAVAGYGVEPQLRFNRFYASEQFAVSVGIGAQYTTHTSGSDELTIAGAFIEPRFVPAVGSSRVFPYVSGRLAFLQQSSNFGSNSTGTAFGAGAGVVIKMTPRLNLDAGAQLVRQQFGDFEFNDGAAGSFNPFTTYAAKIGINFGFPR